MPPKKTHSKPAQAKKTKSAASSKAKVKPKTTSGSKARNAYQLKVTLKDSKPPIWRRVVVPGSIRLYDLHFVMQTLFDWSDSHMHCFHIHGQCYSQREFNLDDAEDEFWVILEDVVKRAGATLTYVYDFGDEWVHEIVVEKIQPAQGTNPAVECLAGERSGPPEDCGGIIGYDNLIEAINDKKHEQHRELKAWLGRKFDPEHIDLKAINAMLKVLR